MSRPRSAPIFRANSRFKRLQTRFSFVTSCRSSSKSRSLRSSNASTASRWSARSAENLVTRKGKPIRLERVGRPEIKNLVLASPAHDARTHGIELRDLYNREDAFALSKEYRSLYESRLDANLAFFDGLDGKTAWPLGPDGRHPLRELLINDFLIVDLARPFAPGSFLEIERAWINDRAQVSAGGRWLDDDILDEMLTLYVNGGRGERLGDGVDAPTKRASLSFPYVREPNRRDDLPLPAFLRS